MTCEICKQPVNIKEKTVYQKVTGWVQNRSKGGPNRRELKRLPEFSHGYCMEYGLNQKLL